MRLAEAYRNTGRPNLETDTLRKLARAKPDYPMVQVLMARAMMTMYPVDYPAVLRTLARPRRARRGMRIHSIFAAKRMRRPVTRRKRCGVPARDRASSHGSGPVLPAGLTYRKLGQAELARQTLSRMEHVKQAANAPRAGQDLISAHSFANRNTTKQ